MLNFLRRVVPTSLFFALLASFLGTTTYAQRRAHFIQEIITALENQNDNSTIDFCTQPYEAVCGAGKLDQQPAAQRRENINTFNEMVSLEAARRFLAQTQPTRQNAASETELHTLIARWTHRHNSSNEAKNYSRVRTEVLNEHLNPLFNTARVQTSLIQSLLQEALPEGPYSQRVGRVRFRTRSDVTTLFAPFPAVRLEMQFAYVGNCGPSGMEQSAYTFSSYGNLVEPFLVLCPGMIIGGMSSQETSANTLLSIFHSIAHELSHAIDSRSYFADYESYGRCLDRAVKLPLSYLPEVSADVRASQAVAELLQTLDVQMQSRNWDTNHRRSLHTKALKRIYDVLCADKSNDRRHPSGRIRIGSILGGNAQVRNLMGCGQPSVPLCSM